MIILRHLIVAALLAVGLFLSTSSAQAAFTLDDITFWLGSGSNRAGMVIDWNDGKGPSLAWGYRWDGAATAEDALTDIAIADTDLYIRVGTSGAFGLPLYGVGYDLDSDGFAITDSTVFTSGIAVTGPSDNVDPADSDDRYEEGWLSEGFWGHYVNIGQPFDGGSWNSGGGISTQNLSNDDWVGLSYAPGFAGSSPSDPSPIPEPASGLLMCIALLTLTRIKRKA